MIPSLTDRLRENGNWQADARAVSKRVPVADREYAAAAAVVGAMRDSGADANEILLFLAASIQNRPGGSALIGPLMAGVARAKMGLTHRDPNLTDIETFVEGLLAEIES